MPLPQGFRLGPYEITTALGAGAMGEVYRARDTRLDRDVAVKVLPDMFASDPERLMRFEREAKTLAALNHSGIAQIYGIEISPSASSGHASASASRAIVMELVEGDDLATRIARGPIPASEALTIARQIAGALAAAHEAGIIHRDLKPANIKVRPDGTVKVLDFGLAKLAVAEPSASAVETMPSPTMTSHGMVLGTAAYMAPEQASGQPVDRRADIWSFGVILFEMLTGRRPFAGDSAVDSITAILAHDPDWSALPDGTPAPIRRLLRRCLEKDRKRRLADISDARLEIDDALAPAGATAPQLEVRRASTWRSVAVLAAVAMGFGLAGAALSRVLSPELAAPQVARFFVPLPEGQHFVGEAGGVALSPDGSELVYATLTGLYRRRAAELDIERIEGLDEVPAVALDPVFSPDGQWLAVWSRDQTIKKIPAAGGAPVTLAQVPGFSGMSWDDDGIVVALQSGTIVRVSPDGAGSETLLQLPPEAPPSSPQMLPRGAGVLFTVGRPSDTSSDVHVVVQRPGSDERKTVVANAGQARYLASGHLVYAVGSDLFVVPFNLDRLEIAGTPVRIAAGVRRGFPRRLANYAVSRSGSLAWVPAGPAGDAGFELAKLDRKGGVERLPLQPANYMIPRVSPDGRFIAYAIVESGREPAIWVYELSGDSAPRRLTFGERARYPGWSHDGSRIIFQSLRDDGGAVFWQRADGTGPAERLTQPAPGQMHFAHGMSKDGRQLFVQVGDALQVLSLEGGTLAPFGNVRSAWSSDAVVSPDGRWVAYSVKPDAATPAALYVQPFPPTGAVYQVPAGGEAYHPMWSRDGTELFYETRADRVFVTRVRTNGGLTFAPPEPLSLAPRAGPPSMPRFYDLLPDGRFISVVPALPGGASGAGGIHVVLNWAATLGG